MFLSLYLFTVLLVNVPQVCTFLIMMLVFKQYVYLFPVTDLS